jgi:hypothetical protein
LYRRRLGDSLIRSWETLPDQQQPCAIAGVWGNGGQRPEISSAAQVLLDFGATHKRSSAVLVPRQAALSEKVVDPLAFASEEHCRLRNRHVRRRRDCWRRDGCGDHRNGLTTETERNRNAVQLDLDFD